MPNVVEVNPPQAPEPEPSRHELLEAVVGIRSEVVGVKTDLLTHATATNAKLAEFEGLLKSKLKVREVVKTTGTLIAGALAVLAPEVAAKIGAFVTAIFGA